MVAKYLAHDMLTLKVPAKFLYENVICSSRLLHILLTLLSNVCILDAKQSGPRSDSVCRRGF